MVNSVGEQLRAPVELVGYSIAAQDEMTTETVSLVASITPPTAQGSRFSPETPEMDRTPKPGTQPRSLPTTWTEPARGLME